MSMSFRTVGAAFYSIRAEASRTAIAQQLAALFKEATPEEASYIAYFSLGELYPPYKGTVFGIAERSAQKIIAQVLGLSPDDILRSRAGMSDSSELLEQAQWKPHRELSVGEVYQRLCDLAQVSGTGSQEVRAEQVAVLLRELHPQDAALIMRIIVGKLRLGFSDMTIIDALSLLLVGNKSARSHIEHAYNICADIGRIAWVACEGGLPAIEQMKVVMGIPIRPAAAERLPSAHDIFDKLGPCIVQPKLDGFRVQVHVWHDEHGVRHTRWFSRNLQSMPDMFPELEVALAQCQFDSVIMEGEAIAYDEATGNYLPFQDTVKRKRKHDIAEAAEEFPLRLVLFDILLLNGKVLLDEKHAERYKILSEVVAAVRDKVAGALVVVEEKKILNGAELEAYFLMCVEHGLEGIIAKRDDAVYQPGKRNFNWIKLKRQSVGNLEDTLDAVVLGYYYGRGKRAAFGIGACLIGVLDAEQDRFVTIAKIGTGFTDEEWIALKKQCDTYAVFDQPARVICAPMLKPDVWVTPEIVLEIAADEITRSPVHTAAKNAETAYGLALRFPRVMSVRVDKSPNEVTTVAEVQALYEHQR